MEEEDNDNDNDGLFGAFMPVASPRVHSMHLASGSRSILCMPQITLEYELFRLNLTYLQFTMGYLLNQKFMSPQTPKFFSAERFPGQKMSSPVSR